MLTCCAPECKSRFARDYGGVPLCRGHYQGVLGSPVPESVVYYLTHADRPGLVKIGRTTRLNGRINQLGGKKVTVIATEPGGPELERERHRQFAAMRAEGEWFHFAAAILLHVHSLTT
jgi:Meiotically up-regulated gene 113